MDDKNRADSGQIKNEIKNIIILAAVLVGYLVFFLITGKGIPCLFRLLTGLRCPGCGMTHAIAALARGDVQQALLYNQLCLNVLPLGFLYLLFRYIRHLLTGYEGFRIWEYLFLAVMLFVTLCYGVLRNIYY